MKTAVGFSARDSAGSRDHILLLAERTERERERKRGRAGGRGRTVKRERVRERSYKENISLVTSGKHGGLAARDRKSRRIKSYRQFPRCLRIPKLTQVLGGG
jgi:hypothetical protein